MKVGEVVERINNGEKVQEIALELGTSKDTLSDRLKALSFIWDNSQKKRIYKGEGEPPLDLNMTEVIKTRSNKKVTRKKVTSSNKNVTPVTKSNNDITSGNIKVTSATNDLTPEEINEIRALLKEWKTQPLDTKAPLSEKLSQLEQTEKDRRTFVIDKVTMTKLDRVSKENRINKSDLLHIALLELFEKYEL